MAGRAGRRHRREARRRAGRRARALTTSAVTGLMVPTLAQATSFSESVEGDLPDSFGMTLALPTGTDEVSGELVPSDDEDYFRFESLSSEATFELEAALQSGLAARFEWLDSSEAVLQNEFPTPEASHFLSGDVPSSGVLRFAVTPSEGDGAAWSALLDLTAGDPLYSEAEGGDLGDAFGVRTQLGSGIERVQGAIDPSGEADFFTLNGLPAGSNFVLRLDSSDGAPFYYDLYDASGSALDSTQISSSSESNLAFFGSVPADGRLRLGVEPSESGAATWGVQLALGDPTQEYDESESGDLAGSALAPSELPDGTSLALGDLDAGTDDADVFTMPAPSGGEGFVLGLGAPSSGTVTYEWLDDEGAALETRELSLFSDSRSLSGPVPESGEITLRVQPDPGESPDWSVAVAVPEPGPRSAGAAALAALAGLFRARRRR